MESKKLVLYHGTSAARWDDIRQRGLLPRSVTGRRCDWTFQSRQGFVYLTDAYPVYYAMAAADPGDGYLILRVEVSPDDLYPDEDFISWALAKGNVGEQMKLLPDIDPAQYKDYWIDSLQGNGMACTPHVPPNRVTAHRVIRPDSLDLVLHLGGDALPTPRNYRLFGARYRTALEALFEQGEAASLAIATEPLDLTGIFS